MFRTFWFDCGMDVDGCGMRRILNELFLCSDFDLPNRAASSEGDEHLAKLIFTEFEKQIMEPWTDEHYVQLQTPNRFDATHTNLWMLALGKWFLKVSFFSFAASVKTVFPLVRLSSTLKGTWPTAPQERSQ